MDTRRLKVTDGQKVDVPRFAAGDIVILNSGGPLMTVASPVPMPNNLDGYGWACDWFLNGNSTRGVFEERELVLMIRKGGSDGGEEKGPDSA
jgi:uncharacterized protein YodC (DUF2158 family)